MTSTVCTFPSELISLRKRYCFVELPTSWVAPSACLVEREVMAR